MSQLMLNPVDFPEKVIDLKPPHDENGVEMEGCLPLPVWYNKHDREDHRFISCWELTEEQKAEIAKTGKIWLVVYSAEHPPVSLQTETPFYTYDDFKRWDEQVKAGASLRADQNELYQAWIAAQEEAQREQNVVHTEPEDPAHPETAFN